MSSANELGPRGSKKQRHASRGYGEWFPDNTCQSSRDDRNRFRPYFSPPGLQVGNPQASCS